MMKHLVPLVVSSSLVALVGCELVPPTNPCDPEVDAELRGNGRIEGHVHAQMKRSEPGGAAFAQGEVTITTNTGAQVTNLDDGVFSVEVEPGLRSLTFTRDGFLPVRTSLLEVEACQLLTLDEPVLLVDASLPSPLGIVPPPAFTSALEIPITIEAHSADVNMAWYDYRVGNGEWVSEDWSLDEWTVELQPNRKNIIAFRARDWMQNVSAEGFVEVTHDDVAPTAPLLTTVAAGPGRVDLSWSASVDENLVAYEIAYGDSPDEQNGTVADQGPSPIRVSADVTSLRLTGLVDDHVLYVSVRAIDAAANVSAPETPTSVRPGQVTPVVTATAAGVGAATRAAFGARYAALLDEDGALTVLDVERTPPLAVVASTIAPDTVDVALEADVLYRLTATSLEILRVGASSLTSLATLALPDGGLCSPTCTAVALSVSLGDVVVVTQRGDIWTIDARDPASPVDEGIVPTLSAQQTFTGPARRFGRYLAVGSVEPIAPDAHAVAILDLQFMGPLHCAQFTPATSAGFQETFYGPALGPRDDRPTFDVDGRYLALGHDGAVVVYALDDNTLDLASTCFTAFNDGFPLSFDTTTRGVGRYELGLRTARAVRLAGATLAVAAYQRSDALFAESSIDIVSLESRQDLPGHTAGVVAGLARRGRVDVGARFLEWRGAQLLAAGDQTMALEVFSPDGPRFVTAVGENPTGMNVAWGTHVIHQRTDRGVGVWDFSRASAPSLANLGTCVPACFEEQDLAGDAVVVDGLLVSAFSKPDGTGVAVSDVASDPTFPSSLATLDNPCVGRARGFVVRGARAYLGCAAENVVHTIDLARPQDGIDVVDAAATAPTLLAAPVRDLALATLASGARVLLVLTPQGRVEVLTDPDDVDDAPLAVPTTVAPDNGLDLGLDFGLALAVRGATLYVVGGTSTDACDPVFAGCQVQENRVVKVDLDDTASIETFVTGAGEPKQTLRIDGDLALLGRSSPGYPYELRDPTTFALRSVASPNPLPLEALFIGGHLVTASFQVFALE